MLFCLRGYLFLWLRQVLVAARRALAEVRGLLPLLASEGFPLVAAQGLRSWGAWVEPTVLKEFQAFSSSLLTPTPLVKAVEDKVR